MAESHPAAGFAPAPALGSEIIDSIDLPIVVVGRNGAVASFNRAAAAFFSLRSSDAGKRLAEIPVLDKIPRIEAICEDAIARAASCQGEVRDATGSWHVLRITPYQGSDQEIAGAVLTLTNVTAVRASLEQAVYEREHTKAIINTVSDALVVIDEDLQIQTANQAFYTLFQVSRERILGVRLDQLGPDWAPRLRNLVNDSHASGSDLDPIEIQQTSASGDRRTLSLTARSLASRGTSKKMTLLTIQDITERRRLEESLISRAEALALADRSKDEFLAMLAHELRNPLAPLHNAAEILQSADAGEDERAQAQGILSRQIKNMNRMVDDLLDVSRITQGKIVLRKMPVALEAILDGAISLARSTCIANRQNLTVTLPDEPVFLDGDATRLEQVFYNLLNNACKYSGEGSHISVHAERVSGSELPEVIVRVSDDGIGMDPELVPRVFDLFVQASRAPDRAHGGLGIGLTLVQRLVKLHDGSIEARSEGLGKGAEFVIRLPVLKQAPGPPGLLPQVLPEKPRRILIVDDNTDSARTLAIIQKRRGHITEVAFAGPEALALVPEFLPDVVLLDIGLPGMDGFEVARSLRAMPVAAGAFLVAMSGYSTDADRSKAIEAGFDRYLVKPVDLEELRLALETICAKS